MTARLLLPTCTVVAAALLAACGSSGAGTTAASTPAGRRVTTTATGPAGSTRPDSKAAPSTLDVCAVLPPAQAARLAAQPYTTGSPATAEVSGWTFGCAYNNADATAEGVNVNVDTGSKGASTWQLVSQGGYTPVAGLGDKALWDGDNTLYVLAGPTLVQVNGLSSQDRSVALARVVLAAVH